MKLFTQYNRITLWVLVGFFLLSSAVYYTLMRGLLFQELDKSLVKIEKRVKDYVQRNGSFPDGEPLDDLRIRHVEVSGPGTGGFRLIPPTKGRNSDNIRELDFFMPLNGRWQMVTISRNLEGVKATAQMVGLTALVTLLIVVSASLIVNQVLFRRLWRPFYDSMEAIGHFQLGKEALPGFADTGVEEFNFMNDQFSKMAIKVNNEWLVLKEFTENASHEMQTPLAVIRSKLDLAIQDQQLSERQSSILQSAYASVKKLASLNRSLLLIAKISNDQYSDCEVVNIKERLADKIGQFEELWKNRLEVSYELNDAEIIANSNLIDILLNNLFSNASKHNVPDGMVMIRLSAFALEISNTGRPVPLDERRMFHRFYKGSPEDENNGLGLSIIKQICDLSGITPSYSHSENIHVFRLEWDRSVRQAAV